MRRLLALPVVVVTALLAAGAANAGRIHMTLFCTGGLGQVTVTVTNTTNEHSVAWGTGKLSNRLHGIPVSFSGTVTDLTTNTLLFSFNQAKGKGHGMHRRQAPAATGLPGFSLEHGPGPAARREVETQTVLAAKASEEASRLKQAKASGGTELETSLQHERERGLANEPKESARRLSSESVYLEIAALRAFYRFAENEKTLPANIAENLSLPRRWQRLPKSTSIRVSI